MGELKDGAKWPKPTLAATSEPEAAKVKQPLKLPPKKQDCSQYLDGLTDAQTEAASLKWEYGLSVNKIYKRLGISRPAVDERLRSAKNKMNSRRSSLKRSTARRHDHDQ
jgi:DNA-directed RNA polymerase specialized sigma24 family protein